MWHVKTLAMSGAQWWCSVVLFYGASLCSCASLDKVEDVGAGTSFLASHPYVLVLISVSTVAVISVFVIFLCGGCTDMEVGSDGHEACGSSRSKNYGYDSVAQDVNTQVMSAGHTLANDPYTPEQASSALPYSLRPAGVEVNHNFAGYAPNSQPSSPSYQTSMPSYGQTAAGYQPSTAGYQPSAPSASRPGANRPAVPTSEPPPPNYFDALQGGGQQQAGQQQTRLW